MSGMMEQRLESGRSCHRCLFKPKENVFLLVLDQTENPSKANYISRPFLEASSQVLLAVLAVFAPKTQATRPHRHQYHGYVHTTREQKS